MGESGAAGRLAALVERIEGLLVERERAIEALREENESLWSQLAEARRAAEAEAALRAEAAETLDAAIAELRAAAEEEADGAA